MSYHEAQNILDARRAGKDMPESVVLQALEMTGDYTIKFSRDAKRHRLQRVVRLQANERRMH